MKEKVSPLFSQYIIDGVPMEQTPFNALYDCLDGNGTVDVPDENFANIVDEYMDKEPTSFEYNPENVSEYVERISRSGSNRRKVDLAYPVGWTRAAINDLLLDTLFKAGHFVLEELLLMAKWDWNNGPAGNLAAFYDSTVTAGRYLFDIGVRLDRYFVEENHKDCHFELSVRSRIPSRRACPSSILPDPESWIIYVPFDSGRYQLGGSALSTVVGHGSGAEMEASDPDYFVDCYEVLRELVEDGVLLSGVPVGRGGVAVAASRYCGSRVGITLDAGGVMSAVGEPDPIKILFAEKPGVLVQIKDSDYDYVDSQLLLQEIAYFPLGHPDPSGKGVKFTFTNRDSVSGILDSLLSQASEGED